MISPQKIEAAAREWLVNFRHNQNFVKHQGPNPHETYIENPDDQMVIAVHYGVKWALNQLATLIKEAEQEAWYAGMDSIDSCEGGYTKINKTFADWKAAQSEDNEP